MTKLTDNTQVTVSISGRFDTLTMDWERARSQYVFLLGTNAIEECRNKLETGGQWIGYTAYDHKQWLCVSLENKGDEK